MSNKVPNSATAPIHGGDFKRAPMRPMISEYDPKKHGVKTELSDMVLTKYKCEKNDVPITVVNGSTLPLVEKPDDEEAALYNPFEHRKLAHPTSDLDTLIHLLKGSLGSGILAMPFAFANAGWVFGLFATLFIGIVCTYCVHILVKCAHKLCRRTQTPSLGFAEVAEAAFLVGPRGVQKYARLAKATINLFLVIDLIGCCCVYVGFVGRSVKPVVEEYFDFDCNLKYYMAMILPLLLIFSLIKNLKYLAPFSMVANILIGISMGITFYYIFRDTSEFQKELPKMASFETLPIFFGTAIFALEGIGVVMPLENNMKTPTHFIGCPGVLNIGMFLVVALYSTVGFFGYLRFGNETKISIIDNISEKEVLAQCAKLMIGIAMFLTYGLQFYVPMEIIWKNIKHHFGAHRQSVEYLVRIGLVIFTVLVAIAVPKLDALVALVGAVCLSTLGLMFPSIIELVTVWEEENGLGLFKWRLWKNILIVCFGLLGFITGSIVSITQILKNE